MAHHCGPLSRVEKVLDAVTSLWLDNDMSNTDTTPATKSFTVGTTYACRSFCDHNCVWTFTVTARTAKFVTLTDDAGKSVRVGIRVWNGVESCSPLGTYSMAPVLTAEKVLVAA